MTLYFGTARQKFTDRFKHARKKCKDADTNGDVKEAVTEVQ
jgi:hypothetical protein